MQIKTIMNELSTCTCQNGHHQKSLQITNVGEDVEKKETCTFFIGMSLASATMEDSIDFPQKTKNRNTIMIQQFHSWIHIWKKMKTQIQKDTCTLNFIAALFIIAKIEKQHNFIH